MIMTYDKYYVFIIYCLIIHCIIIIIIVRGVRKFVHHSKWLITVFDAYQTVETGESRRGLLSTKQE